MSLKRLIIVTLEECEPITILPLDNNGECGEVHVSGKKDGLALHDALKITHRAQTNICQNRTVTFSQLASFITRNRAARTGWI